MGISMVWLVGSGTMPHHRLIQIDKKTRKIRSQATNNRSERPFPAAASVFCTYHQFTSSRSRRS